MRRYSLYRILVIIMLIISLSSIIAMVAYSYTKDNSEQIVSQLPIPVKIKTVKKPNVNKALTTLFSIPASDNKIKVNKDTLASLWFEKSFNDGLNKYHAIFIKNQMVDSETHEIYGSHADAPIISAVVYTLNKGEWVLASAQENIGVFGSWGDTPPIKQVQLLTLAKGNIALLLDISYSGQGYTKSGKTIFSYYQNNWTQLGYLPTSGDNSGVCDDTVKDDLLLSACWSFNGTVNLAENNSSSTYTDIIVKRTGTMEGENRKIIPVKNSLYSFNGEEYLEVDNGED